jgi:preprotein translocase subunit SecY
MFNKAKQANLSVSQGGLTELKQRLLVLAFALIVYRIGAHIPVPGLDPARLASYFHQHENGVTGLFNMFSGGAFYRLTLFALGIMPYISASIIVQLFSSVSPRLAALKKEGESGQRKINQYTRYGTLFLAIFQSIGMSKWLAGAGIAYHPGFNFYFVATATLVTGTMFLMWLGEQVTERGIGNGISMIIFVGIVSRLPSAVVELFEQVREGQIAGISLILVVVLVVAVTLFVVFVESAQRRITVNYAQRQQGRKIYAAQSSHLPLKLNMAGVIPPIFASSIILLPATLAQWFGHSDGMHWLNTIGFMLSPGHPLYVILLGFAIVFFCFFYTALVFNPRETADNLKRSNAYIPGIRPGDQTAKYVDDVMTRLTVAGSVYLILVALLPQFMVSAWHVPFYFGGTSLLITVVVVMDFVAQLQSHLMSHQYDALMRKSKLKR